jgi:uncharacterized protein YjbI with pentapeptide repeats
MRARLQKIWKQLPKLVGLMLLYIGIILVLAWSVWRGRAISWTGFGDYTTPTGEFIRGKTVWDWMELLVIPATLLFGGYWLNRSEREADHRREEHQRLMDRIRAEGQAESERRRAEERSASERYIAADRQHEAALQSYIDRMAELLLNEKLLTSPSEEARNVARIRTLTVLRVLDAKRKGIVLHFLAESGLIHKNPIVDLNGADLRSAELTFADLRDVCLRSADLAKANLVNAFLMKSELPTCKLTEAKLSNAKLNACDLRYASIQLADLSDAFLIDADLSGADLTGANLTHARLRGANLTDANLSEAQLYGAEVSPEQLMSAATLENATMPDGKKYAVQNTH